MRLGEKWKEVITKAWSMRLIAGAAVLSGIEVALPFFFEVHPIPAGSFAALSGVVTIAAFMARIMVQKDLPNV